jgi:hypothetical protein
LFGFGEHPGQKGGPKTGANPTDKGKAGSKRHLVSDRRGIPLCVMLSAANVHDSMVFEELIDTIETIKRPRGSRFAMSGATTSMRHFSIWAVR